MSSIGFAPREQSEVEQLRSAYRSMNDVTRNIASAAKCIKNQDFRLAEHHLRAAEWHAGEVKRIIVALGQSKRSRVKRE